MYIFILRSWDNRLQDALRPALQSAQVPNLAACRRACTRRLLGNVQNLVKRQAARWCGFLDEESISAHPLQPRVLNLAFAVLLSCPSGTQLHGLSARQSVRQQLERGEKSYAELLFQRGGTDGYVQRHRARGFTQEHWFTGCTEGYTTLATGCSVVKLDSAHHFLGSRYDTVANCELLRQSVQSFSRGRPPGPNTDKVNG